MLVYFYGYNNLFTIYKLYKFYYFLLNPRENADMSNEKGFYPRLKLMASISNRCLKILIK